MKTGIAIAVHLVVAVAAGYAGGRLQDHAQEAGKAGTTITAAGRYAPLWYKQVSDGTPGGGYRAAIARARASVVTVQSAVRERGGPEGAVVELHVGSGVILDHDGLVVTSNSLAVAGSQFAVELVDGTVLSAQLVARDVVTGLALLRVRGAGLQPIEVADARTTAVGDVVLAIGDPFGLGQSVTQGIVSAMAPDRSVPGARLIQSDVALHAGSLGGALVDTTGRLVGINAGILSAGNDSGAAVAVPVELVHAMVARLNRAASPAPAREPAPASGGGRQLLVQASG